MALPAKILVVRLGAIGDVANALVFATALRDHDPSVQIGWVTHELARPLVERHPALARTHVWPRKSGWAGLRAVIDELRGEGYGAAVDLQRLQKSAFLARRSGAPRVIGFHRSQVKEQSWIWTNERIPRHADTAHMVERYLAVARYLGAPATQPRHELPVDAEADAWAEAQLAALGGAPIVISVGASKPENRWLAARFGELAARLSATSSSPVCLVGGPNEVELAQQALAAARGAAITDLVGKTGLSQLIALLRRAALFVGCDTGPMHLAVACGVTSVALFGPAEPWRTGPYGSAHRIVRSPPYDADSPLAPTPHQPRMDAITIEDILNAIHAAKHEQ